MHPPKLKWEKTPIAPPPKMWGKGTLPLKTPPKLEGSQDKFCGEMENAPEYFKESEKRDTLPGSQSGRGNCPCLQNPIWEERADK